MGDDDEAVTGSERPLAGGVDDGPARIGLGPGLGLGGLAQDRGAEVLHFGASRGRLACHSGTVALSQGL